MTLAHVGQKIKGLRAAKRISQKSIQEQTGLKQSYLANVERGRIKLPQIANLRKIADGLGVSLEALVEGTSSAALLTSPRSAERTYCPNPECHGANTAGVMNEKKVIAHYALLRYDEDGRERKFCPYCRSELIAVCPKKGCGASILSHIDQYCTRCGEPLYAQWEKKHKPIAEERGEAKK